MAFLFQKKGTFSNFEKSVWGASAPSAPPPLGSEAYDPTECFENNQGAPFWAMLGRAGANIFII